MYSLSFSLPQRNVDPSSSDHLNFILLIEWQKKLHFCWHSRIFPSRLHLKAYVGTNEKVIDLTDKEVFLPWCDKGVGDTEGAGHKWSPDLHYQQRQGRFLERAATA